MTHHAHHAHHARRALRQPSRPQAAAPRATTLIRGSLLATTALLPVALIAAPAAAQAPNAAPTGGQVSAGSATIRQSATTTRIDQTSNRAAIDWRRFDVGRDQTVQFNQPSAQSWTLNRVNSPDPSLIAGRIQANGGVAIVNQSGVVFGQGAQVNVGSLIASAAGITNQNFMAGNMVFDQAARPGARVENHGSITVAERGLASLVGPTVANSGTINARLGRVALAGAETFTLDLAGDGLLSLDVTQAVRQGPQGGVALVTNSGTIEAAGGSVLLTAEAARGVVDTLLRNTGRISADAASGTAAGTVVLRGGAGGDVQVAAGTISATGTAPGVSGGTVAVTSRGGAVGVAREARLDASGAAGGGTVRIGDAATARVTVAGQASARGTGAAVRGGLVAAQAKEAVTIESTGKLDASGTGGGGTVTAGTTGVGRAQTMAQATTVERGAELRADATDAGNGGTIAVNSSARTDMRGLLSARGGAHGGDGGFVEVSGLGLLSADGHVDVRAPLGTAGTLLIDPTTISITNGAAQTTPPDNILNAGGGTVLRLDVTTLPGGAAATITSGTINNFAGRVRLEASDSITVQNSVSGANRINKSNGGLTLLADNTITINGTIQLTGTGAIHDFTATATTITGNGAVTVANGQTISLRADAFTGLSASLNAGATGIVELGPRNAGTAIADVAAYLPTGTITAGTLRIGQTRAGDRADWASGTTTESGTVTAGAVTVAAAAPIDLSAFATVELAGASIALGAAVEAGTTLDLLATTGSITQTAAGIITAGALRARAETAGQSVQLGTALNEVGTVAAAAGSGVEIRSDIALAVGTVLGTNGVNAGGVVELLAENGNLTQTQIITAGSLRARAFDGAVSLEQANAITGDVAGSAAGGSNAFSIRDANGLAVGTVGGTNGISAPGAVELLADAGNITQTQVITASGLRARALDGSVTLEQLNVVTTVIAGSAAGGTNGFSFRDTSGLAVGSLGGSVGISAPGVVELLAETGNLTQTQIVSAGSLRARALDGAVTLDLANAVSGAVAGSAAGGTNGFSFRDASGLAVGAVGGTTGITAPGVVDLLADAGNITQTEAIGAGSLRARASGGAVALADQPNTIAGEVAGSATGGTNGFAIRDDSGLVVGTVAGTSGITAPGTVHLVADAGTITQTQSVDAGTLTASAATSITLASTSNVFDAIGTVTAAADITLVSGTGNASVAVTGAVSSSGAGTVRIETPRPLSVTATGSVGSGTLAGADAGTINLWGQSIDLQGAVQAGSLVTLAARGGSLDATAGATTPATITQSGAGIVTTRRLGLFAVGDATLGLNNAVDGIGALATGGVTLFSTRDLAILAGLSVPLPAGGTTTTGTGVQSAAGSIALSTPNLTVANPIAATAASQTITLTADTVLLSGAGAVSANTTNGTVVIRTFTDATDLVLSAASLDFSLFSANTLSLRSLGSGGAPTPGAVEISGALNLTSVGVLDMQGASVTQTGGTLTVGAVSGAASAGDFSVQQAGNAIGALGDTSASGAVNIRTGGTLTVNGPVDAGATSTLRADAGLVLNGTIDVGTANTLNLRTDGTVTQPGGSLTAGTLDVRGAAGGAASVASVALGRANAVGSVFAQSLGAVTFRDADGFSVAGIAAAGQTVDLLADAGDITQTGAITAGSLRARALDGAVQLGSVANTIAGAVAGSAAGGSNGFAIRDDNGLAIGTVAGTSGITAPGVVDLLADAGSITQSQAISAGSLRARAEAAGASVDLNDAANQVGTLSGRANVDFLFFDGQALTIGTVLGTAGVQAATGQVVIEATAIAVQAATAAATTIDLLATTGSITQDAAGVLTAPQLRARAEAGGASVLLGTATSQVGTLSGRADADFEFLSGQALAVGTVLATPGVVGTTGHVTVTATAIDVATAITAATFIDLRATTGSITQGAAGVLTAPQLRARAEAAGGSVLLDDATNQVGTLAARANGDVEFLGGQALTVDIVEGTAGVQAATGAVRLTATSLDFVQGASAATLMALGATTGGITQDATGILVTPLLTGQSALATDLTDAANAVDRLGAFRAGIAATTAAEAAFGLRSAQSLLTVDGLVTAGFTTGDVQQVAGGRLSIFADDMDILAGSSVRVAAGTIELAPHTAGRAIVLGADAGGPVGGALFLNNAEIGRLSTWNQDVATPRFGVVAVGSAAAGDVFFGGDVDLRTTGASATPTDFLARGLALRSSGTVTQTAGRLNVEQLGILAGGSVTLHATNLVNRVAALDGMANGLEATGAITLRVNATLPEVADPLTGFTSFFTVRNLVVGADIVANDPVGAATAAITLVADDLQLDQGLTAIGGTVTLRPVTAGRTVLLGFAADPTTALHLSAAELTGGNIDVGATGVLRIGAVATDLRVAGPLEGTARTPAAGDITFGEQNLTFGASVATLELLSSGNIIQTTGTLAVDNLAGLAGGRVALGTRGNAILRIVPLTGTASFDTSDGIGAVAALPATAGFRSGYGQTAIAPANGSFSLSTDSALTLTGDVVARGITAPVTLRGQSLALQAAVTSGAADAIDLLATTGSITQDAAGVLTTPLLRARAEAAGGSVLLGDATSAVDAFAARADGHVELLSGQDMTVGTVLGTAGVAAATGHVELTAPSLHFAAAGTASTFIDLLATAGDISQDVAGVLTAPQLRARAEAAGRTVILVSAANQVATLAARADAGLAFLGGQALTVGTVLGTAGAVVANGGMSLQAPSIHFAAAGTASTAMDLLATTGSITQDAAGVLTAPQLRARAEGVGASVRLDEATNQVGTLAGRADVDVEFSGGQALIVGSVLGTDGVAAATGLLALTAPSIHLAEAATAATTLDLLATTGSITQDAAGVLSAPQLRARAEAAGASVLLDDATNQVGTLAARAGLDAEFLDGQALTVGTVLGTAGVSAGTGHVALSATAIDVAAAATAATFIDLLATTGSITQGAAGVLTAPQLRARAEAAGASVLLDDATNQVGTLAALADADLEFLDGQALTLGTVLGTVGVAGATGHVALTATTIDVAAAVTAATFIDLLATTGSITQGAAGVLTAPQLRARAEAAGGSVLLADATNQVGALAARGGVDVEFLTGQALTIGTVLGTAGVTATTGHVEATALSLDVAAATTAATFIDLLATTGSITQGAAGVLTAPQLRARAEGAGASVLLDDATNQVGTWAARGGVGVEFLDGQALTIGSVLGTAGVSAATGHVALTATAIDVAAATTAATFIDLLATTGSITQGAAGVLTAPQLRARAEGVGASVLLDDATNQVGTLAGRAAVDIEFLTGQALTVGTVLGTAGVMATTGHVALTAPSLDFAAAGTAATFIDLLATTGSITQGAAGALTAPALRARAESAGASVLLGDAASQVGTLAARADLHVEFLGGQALTVGTVLGTAGVTAATGRIILTAPSIDLAAAATAATIIDLLATTGSITQGAAGVLSAPQLRARAEAAGASVLLDDATNQVTRLAGRAGLDLQFLDGQSLVVGTVLGTQGVSATAGHVALTAPAIRFADPGAAATFIDLLATTGSITQDATGVLSAPQLRARAESAGESVLLADASNLVGTLAARAGLHVEFLDGQALTVGTVLGTAGVSAGTGQVALSATAIDVAAATTAATFIDLLATTGSITQGAAGVLTAPQLRARAEAAGASVLLDDATNQIGTLAARAAVDVEFLDGQALTAGTVLGTVGVVGATGHVALSATAIDVASATTAATFIDLLATTGSVTQGAAGVMTAPQLRARAGAAGASVLLADATNQVGTLAARGGVDVEFLTGQALTLGTVLGTAGVTAATGHVEATALSLDVASATTAATFIDLLATTGSITQGAAGVLTAPQLRARAEAAGASVLLDDATNQVGTWAARGGVGVEFLDGQALTIGSVLGTAGVSAATGHVALTATAIDVAAATTAATFIDLLASTGSITQEAAGVLTAPALRARAEAGGASVLLDDATNQVGTLAARANLDMEFLTGQALSIGTVQGTAGVVAATGHIVLAAPSIDATAAVTAATSIDLLATTGNITQNASGVLTSPGLRARAESAGASVLLDDANNQIGSLAGRANLDIEYRNIQDDRTLRIESVLGTQGLVATTGHLSLEAASIRFVSAGTAGTFIDLLAISTLPTIGSITQELFGVLTAPELRARAAVGASVGLVSAFNQVGTVAGHAGLDFGFRNGQPLTIGTVLGTVGVAAPQQIGLDAQSIHFAQSSTASRIDLLARSGSITQEAAAVLTATELRALAEAAGTSVRLADATNQVGVLAARANLDIEFLGGQALTIGTVLGTAGVSAATGHVALTATSMDLAAPSTAATFFDLLATTGSITQGAAGVLTAPQLRARADAAGASVLLDDATNQVGTLAARANLDMEFLTGQALSIGTVQGTAGVVAATGHAALAAPSIDAAAAVSAATFIDLLASTGSITQGAAGVLTTPALRARAEAGGASVLLDDATNQVGLIGGRAAQDLALLSDQALTIGTVLGTSGVQASAGHVELTGASLSFAAAVTAATTMDLLATTGSITQGAAGILTAPQLRARAEAAGASVRLADATNQVGTLAGRAGLDLLFLDGQALTVGTVLGTTGITAATGHVQLTAPTIAVQAPITSGSDAADFIDLLATGAGGITQTAAGILTTPQLRARAEAPGASVRLDDATSQVGIFAGLANRDVEFLDGQALTIGSVLGTAGAQSAAGNIAVTAQALTLLTPVTATGGNITLVATGGDVLAGDINVTAGGVLSLSAAANGRMVRLAGGSYSADYILVMSGPALDGSGTVAFSGTSFSVGTAMLVAGGGGFGTAADSESFIGARQSGTLPLVFIDTRRSATALRALPPGVFSPDTRDVPGVTPNLQTWQVFSLRRPMPPGARVIGVADGSGAATDSPAGDVILNLQAGDPLDLRQTGLPVFLLMDGAAASGTLTAGRLGVHGVAGEARAPGRPDLVLDITGELFGISGTAAAQFGRAATTDPREQSLYRVNNCVIDTINCVAPSVAQPVIIPITNRIDIRSDAPRLDPDVLLPNIAEEDY